MKRLLAMMCIAASLTANAKDNKELQVYICFGQSNMEGNAKIEEVDSQNIYAR